MTRLFLIIFFFATSIFSAHAEPKVVVSIKPVHSLAANIMKGIAEPELLLDGTISPHDFTLKPSQAKNLQEADLIIWVGEALEASLSKSIHNLEGKTKIIELLELEGLTQHKYRETKSGHGDHDDHAKHEEHDDHDKHEDHDDHAKHEEHDHEEHAKHEEHDDHDEHAQHDHGDNEFDAHLWLDVSNAMKVAKALNKSLGEIDPSNKPTYQANTENLIAKLSELENSIEGQIKQGASKNYMVFHDAYQYFEKQFGISEPHVISVNPEVPLSAARVANLQEEIREDNIKCVFSEPQFPAKVVTLITENTDVSIAELDPLGSGIEKGNEHYFLTMQMMSKTFSDCFNQ